MATPPPRPAPTLDEVALRAGVSRSVASRVINEAPHVSRDKRAENPPGWRVSGSRGGGGGI